MYMESICRAGKTKIVWKYHCYHAGKPGEKRKKKANKTKESQQKVNDRQTERRLTGILNENFDGTSWYVTWSYREDLRPKDIEELKLQISQLLRDLRKLYKKEGLVLRYVWTAEVGKRGAVHIHMVLSEIDARKLRGIWKYGYVTMKPMDPSGQYSRLASYFLKYFQKTRETDRQIQKHAYNPSRNLSRPEPRKEKISAGTFRRKVREPKGWYIDKKIAQDNGGIRYGITEDGYEYIYYILVKEDP